MYDGSSIFTAMLAENGDILVASTTRENKKVGIDTRREQELLNDIGEMRETLDNWREVLISNGLLKIPKTPEEIAQEQAKQQAEINQALLQAIQNLNNQVEALKNGNTGNGNEPSLNTVGQDSESDRQKPAGSKGSNKPSSKNPAGNPE